MFSSRFQRGLRDLLMLAVCTAATAAAAAPLPPAGSASAPSVRRVKLTAPVTVAKPVLLPALTTCGRGGKVSVTPC